MGTPQARNPIGLISRLKEQNASKLQTVGLDTSENGPSTIWESLWFRLGVINTYSSPTPTQASTVLLSPTQGEDDDLDDLHSRFPDTREPSLEPPASLFKPKDLEDFAKQIHAHGQPVPTVSSCVRLCSGVAHCA